MKHKIFLFAMLFLAISQSLFSIELDTVWVSDEYGQILFQHPVSKNILIAKNGITELYSDNGKFVRNLSYDISNIEISPDGSKYLTSGNNTYIYNFETGEGLDVIEFGVYSKFLSNDIVICRDRITSNLIIYNLITKEKRNISISDNNGWITTLATSPDGKYISYATYKDNNTTDSKVYLYLMDAETMKVIKELGNWETGGKEIRSIHFSPDSKYLTYEPEYYSSNFPLNIYNVEKRSLIKTIKKNSFNFEYGSLTLLANNLFILNGANEFSLPQFKFELHNLEENRMLFGKEEFALGGGIYNKELNHLYGTSKITMCLNIENIISGIPPTNPINIRYINKRLIINNNNNKLINNITINTIEGREVYKQNFEQIAFQNQIEIPLDLSNGLYFININSGHKITTHKLLVKE